VFLAAFGSSYTKADMRLLSSARVAKVVGGGVDLAV